MQSVIDISVIVPVVERYDDWRNCTASIKKAWKTPEVHEFIYVLDGDFAGCWRFSSVSSRKAKRSRSSNSPMVREATALTVVCNTPPGMSSLRCLRINR